MSFNPFILLGALAAGAFAFTKFFDDDDKKEEKSSEYLTKEEEALLLNELSAGIAENEATMTRVEALVAKNAQADLEFQERKQFETEYREIEIDALLNNPDTPWRDTLASVRMMVNGQMGTIHSEVKEFLADNQGGVPEQRADPFRGIVRQETRATGHIPEAFNTPKGTKVPSLKVASGKGSVNFPGFEGFNPQTSRNLSETQRMAAIFAELAGSAKGHLPVQVVDTEEGLVNLAEIPDQGIFTAGQVGDDDSTISVVVSKIDAGVSAMIRTDYTDDTVGFWYASDRVKGVVELSSVEEMLRYLS